MCVFGWRKESRRMRGRRMEVGAAEKRVENRKKEREKRRKNDRGKRKEKRGGKSWDKMMGGKNGKRGKSWDK